MEPVKHKRRALSVSIKYEIIQELLAGRKQADLCHKYTLSKSTVANIWKNKEIIINAFDNKNINIKKIRKCSNEDLDTLLYQWFCQQSSNVNINNATLQMKAQEFGRLLNKDPGFECSPSWIERFKKRHNISRGKIIQELPPPFPTEYQRPENSFTNLSSLNKADFRDEDIFHASETALLYKLMPKDIDKIRNELLSDGNLPNKRLTILAIVNLTGTEKRKLLVIGKSVHPKSFQFITNLPISYKSNKKALMTPELLFEELYEWDLELNRKKRKILLLIDNCPEHSELRNLKNIRIIFLQSSINIQIHPRIEGIIQYLKSNYRKYLLFKIMSSLDLKQEISITLLDCVNLLHKSWQNITMELIQKCYQQVGISTSTYEFGDQDDIPLSEWIKLNRQTNITKTEDDVLLSKYIDLKIFGEFNMDDYIHLDDLIMNRDLLNIDEIFIKSEPGEVSDDESDEGNPRLALTEAYQNVNSIRNFLQMHNAPDSFLDKQAEIELFIDQINIKHQNQMSEGFSSLSTN